MSKKLISIAVPVYNEAPNIKTCYEALCKIATDNPAYDFEFVFTDNCSIDTSYDLLKDIAKKDSRLTCYSFSKNFGYQKSIYAGLSKTKGEAAIIFDCDLQDPPELVTEFLAKWEEGYKVVYGVRKKRDEPKILEASRKLFYRLINFLSEDHLPLDAGDFRLVDRRIIDLMGEINDYNPYLRGIMSNFGFKQTGILYERRERTLGKSKFNFPALVMLAVDGIISQSIVPLRFATFTGVVVSLFTLLGIIGYVMCRLVYHLHWPAGFTTLTILMLFSLCLNSFFLGIIGEYLARIYSQVRTRPIVIIEKSTASDQ
ncbi:MAG: glycosyltransferase family 2 protein [Gammaproteobacteria bacterium]